MSAHIPSITSFIVALLCSVSIVTDRRHVGRGHVGHGYVGPGPGYIGPGYVGFLGFGNRGHPLHLSIMQSANKIVIDSKRTPFIFNLKVYNCVLHVLLSSSVFLPTN